MANTNVPYRVTLQSLSEGQVRIAWTALAQRGYKWKVYAGVSGTPPIAGPALNATPILSDFLTFALASVPGFTGQDSVFVAVTSVNDTNLQESAQSEIIEVEISKGTPGSSETTLLVGMTPSGRSSYLSTTEDGHIVVGGSVLPSGGATEAKQDAGITQLTQINAGIPVDLGQEAMADSMPVVIASDQSTLPTQEATLTSSRLSTVSVGGTSVALPVTPLANRRLVAFQNKGATSVFINDGTADGNSWEVPAKGPLTIEAGPGVLFEGFRAAGTGDVTVWEFA